MYALMAHYSSRIFVGFKDVRLLQHGLKETIKALNALAFKYRQSSNFSAKKMKVNVVVLSDTFLVLREAEKAMGKWCACVSRDFSLLSAAACKAVKGRSRTIAGEREKSRGIFRQLPREVLHFGSVFHCREFGEWKALTLGTAQVGKHWP